MRGLIKDQPQEVPVERVGLMPITCGMMAGCGRTDVVIAATRLSTVTGEDGAFVLENVPAGLALHVHAWHPLLQEGVVDVTLRPGAETPVEVSVSSRAAPATPEPTEPSGENPPTPEGRPRTPRRSSESASSASLRTRGSIERGATCRRARPCSQHALGCARAADIVCAMPPRRLEPIHDPVTLLVDGERVRAGVASPSRSRSPPREGSCSVEA
ncbi:MAG: hypothetical protein R3B99_06100 [Polyangiales bacterium]